MKYRLAENKFYVTMDGIGSHVGNIREEAELIARNISSKLDKVLLSISSGLDSQVMLHSFVKQDLPFECSFLYSPGYNDVEFNQLKILENKYGFKTIIVELDPVKLRDQVIQEADSQQLQRNQYYQQIYLSKLPEDYDFVQMLHSDFVFIKNGQSYLHQGYYSAVVCRDRAFKLLNRKGKHIFFGEDNRFLYSMLTDSVYKSALIANTYFNNELDGYNRYDSYVKPLMYANYWGNELEYFPKFIGIENIEYLNRVGRWHEHCIYIPLNLMLENMTLNETVEYMENYHKPDIYTNEKKLKI
jgi:hypothetical protein